MKALIWRLGRWLILRAYVKPRGDANTEAYRQHVLMHDMKLQIQELRNQNDHLRTALIVERVKHS